MEYYLEKIIKARLDNNKNKHSQIDEIPLQVRIGHNELITLPLCFSFVINEAQRREKNIFDFNLHLMAEPSEQEALLAAEAMELMTKHVASMQGKGAFTEAIEATISFVGIREDELRVSLDAENTFDFLVDTYAILENIVSRAQQIKLESDR